jgi:hypothetical protein
MALHNSKRRRLLCEGWVEEGHDGFVIPPTVAYCVQGKKVWFAEGKATAAGKNLCESEDFGGMTVVESIDQLDLVERDGVTMPKEGRWFVEGPGQRSDTLNSNKRKYKRAIWERIIGDGKSKQQQAIAARGMTGHFEHPADGRTKGPDVALVTVSAKLNEDGVVWAKHELLDTPNGLILQELTRKNVRWGVSTRGNGSVDEAGNVSESDYEMECWDAVMRPSTPGAYPKRGKTNEDASIDEAGSHSRKFVVDPVSLEGDAWKVAYDIAPSKNFPGCYTVDMHQTKAQTTVRLVPTGKVKVVSQKWYKVRVKITPVGDGEPDGGSFAGWAAFKEAPFGYDDEGKINEDAVDEATTTRVYFYDYETNKEIASKPINVDGYTGRSIIALKGKSGGKLVTSSSGKKYRIVDTLGYEVGTHGKVKKITTDLFDGKKVWVKDWSPVYIMGQEQEPEIERFLLVPSDYKEAPNESDEPAFPDEGESFPHRQSALLREDIDEVDKVNLAEADFESVAAITTRLIGMLASGAPQDTSEKSDVSTWLARKLTESLARSRDLLAESVVEHSISAVTASQLTPRPTGEGEVVAGLQKRLAASVQESEALKRELKELSARLDVAEATRDNAWTLVESAEADLTKTQAALALAKSITESAVSAKSVVVEPKLDLARAVEALLIAAPDLNRFAAILSEATTFPALNETVRELIAMRHVPSAQTEPVTEAEASPAPRIARGMLPTPITESVASFDRPKLDESVDRLPENHPARVAARVVARALR